MFANGGTVWGKGIISRTRRFQEPILRKAEGWLLTYAKGVCGHDYGGDGAGGAGYGGDGWDVSPYDEGGCGERRAGDF